VGQRDRASKNKKMAFNKQVSLCRSSLFSNLRVHSTKSTQKEIFRRLYFTKKSFALGHLFSSRDAQIENIKSEQELKIQQAHRAGDVSRLRRAKPQSASHTLLCRCCFVRTLAFFFTSEAISHALARHESKDTHVHDPHHHYKFW
jgi:hypothetical protein